MTTVASPFTGRVVPLDQVNDAVFAEKVLGDGLAVHPTHPEVLAPVDGRIEKLFPGGHGIALETTDGLQVLIHVGLETVHLKGEGFTTYVEEGDDVSTGQRLVNVDLDFMAERGIDMDSPVVILSGETVSPIATGTVTAGDPLFEAASQGDRDA
ncbi:MAG TPA: PTS glucose transporter subunit IIA [Acidimicrobiia bacterium]